MLAVTLIVPKVGELVERPFRFFTRRRAGDLGGGFFLGASLGLVFIPCGGPVLATLTANVATDRVGGWIVAIAIAYAVGAAVPLLAIARGSRGLATRFRQHAQTVRIAGGVLMAAAAVVIYQGWAESLQTKVPGYAQWVQDAIEGSSAAQDRLDRLGGKAEPAFVPRGQQLASRLGKVPLKDYGAAPDVHDVSAWINSRPLSLPRAPRQGRARRLLDVLVHQLPAHAAVPESVGRALPLEGSRHPRRAHAGVRIRT